MKKTDNLQLNNEILDRVQIPHANSGIKDLLKSGERWLITIVGGAGTGKTTLANELAKDPNVVKIITSTTRKPRAGEEDGKDYYFLTLEKYHKEFDNFFAKTSYDGNWYGIHGEVVDLILAKKKKLGVVVVDAKGLKDLNAYCKSKGYHCLGYKLKVNLKKQIDNLKNRGETADKILDYLIIQEQQDTYEKEDPTLLFHGVFVDKDTKEIVNYIKEYIEAV